MVKLQNAKYCLKMDLFFFQCLCMFTLAINFLYFVAHYDVVRPCYFFKSKFLAAKMWAKRPTTARMFLSILERRKAIFTWTTPQ